MTETLHGGDVAAQVVAVAYFALLVVTLVVLSLAPMIARLLGRSAKIPNPLEAVLGTGVLAEPPAGNLASFLRPLLIAAPVALFVGRFSRHNQIRQGIGAGLFIAIFAAIAFLPVESGFAASILPASDWLRFPIAGAAILSVWPILAIPLQLIFGSRALNLGKNIRMMGALAGVGGLFGLFWAITRLLF